MGTSSMCKSKLNFCGKGEVGKEQVLKYSSKTVTVSVLFVSNVKKITENDVGISAPAVDLMLYSCRNGRFQQEIPRVGIGDG